jgi:hypothetical protein
MTKAKPFDISKREVWVAYKKVKANQGAAGVDGQSIGEFEANLADNLYKLWNRLSSGSYLPPPVRRVDIPKTNGGTRPLGIPTVADRIAQEVVRRYLELLLEPLFHRTRTDIDLAARQSTPSGQHDGAAGVQTGSLIATSRGSSIASTMSFCSRHSENTRTAGGCCSMSSAG